MNLKLIKFPLNIINKNFIFLIIIALLSVIAGFFSSETLMIEWIKFIKSYMVSVNFSLLSIFINNFLIAVIMITGGLLVAIPSLFLMIFNFFSLGVMLKYFYQQSLLKEFLISIFPHGIIEIPAIILSCYFGIKVWNSFSSRRENVFLEIKKYYISIMPYFFLAAFIEVYITPYIIFYFLQR